MVRPRDNDHIHDLAFMRSHFRVSDIFGVICAPVHLPRKREVGEAGKTSDGI